MLEDDTPGPLFQVKALIWVQALLGAALLMAFFVVALMGEDAAMLAGIVACGFFWLLGFAPLRTKAEALDAGKLPAGRPLPRWLLPALLWGQLASQFSYGMSPWAAVLLPANLLALGTIFLRGWISNGLDVPFHLGALGSLMRVFIFATIMHALALFAMVARN